MMSNAMDGTDYNSVPEYSNMVDICNLNNEDNCNLYLINSGPKWINNHFKLEMTKGQKYSEGICTRVK